MNYNGHGILVSSGFKSPFATVVVISRYSIVAARVFCIDRRINCQMAVQLKARSGRNSLRLPEKNLHQSKGQLMANCKSFATQDVGH